EAWCVVEWQQEAPSAKRGDGHGGFRIGLARDLEGKNGRSSDRAGGGELRGTYSQHVEESVGLNGSRPAHRNGIDHVRLKTVGAQGESPRIAALVPEFE